MSESDNIKSYSAADIQKYLSGELSSADMHDMEKAAMDDPFLADAIEGMESTRNEYGNEIINSNLAQLNAAIEERSGSGRVIAMKPSVWWWAAAAVVIIISGVFAFNNFKNNSEQATSIAKGEKAKPPAQPTIGPADGSAQGAFAITPSEASKDSSLQRDSTSGKSYKLATKQYAIKPDYIAAGELEANFVSPSATQLKKDTQNLSYSFTQSKPTSLPPVQLNFDTANANSKMEMISGRAAGVKVSDDKVAKSITSANRDQDNIKVGITDIAKAQPRSNQEEFYSNQTRLNNFRGRVLDNNNNLPVANAIVSLDKEKYSTVTNEQGYFQLDNVKDTVAKVNVSIVGYDQKKVQLNSTNTSNEIRLDPSNQALEEVVVVGYGSQRKKSVAENKALSTKVQDATPVIDWVEYEKYLEKKKISDRVGLDAADFVGYKAGEVVVSFLVDKKGQLSSFKIEQSLGKREDAEAIRLIKEGPAWKVTRSKKARATVIVRF